MGLSAQTQTVQLGAEVTAGTAVAAGKKLGSIGFSMSPAPEIQVFTAAGNKYPSVASLNNETTEFDIDGALTYTEIVYLLSGILEKVTPVTVTGTTTWTFTPATASADVVQTYTIEQGSSVRAHRCAYGLISDLTLSYSRTEATISGSGFGTAIEDPHTLTATPTEIELIPVTGTQTLFYLEDSVAALTGATELTGVISCEWSLTNRFLPAWFMDGNSAFSQHVEDEPTLEITLMQEADAEGMELLPIMRTGATKYLRIESTGPVIGAGPGTNKITIDTAVKVTDVGDFSDQDKIYAIEYTLQGFHSASLGSACKAVVINALAAL